MTDQIGLDTNRNFDEPEPEHNESELFLDHDASRQRLNEKGPYAFKDEIRFLEQS